MSAEMPAPAAPESEELVYAAAVVILADDLYPRKLEIVREYIQNASDALDSFSRVSDVINDPTDPLIKVSIQGRSLIIWDNGIGMDAAEIQKLKRIAYSEKKVGREAGYKGIGRLAGIAVAKKLIISSTSFGDPQLHRFEFRARDLHADIDEARRRGAQESATAVLNRHITISAIDVDPRDHYTMVELREIDDPDSDLLDATKLREFVGDIAPVGFDPSFTHAATITSALRREVPDYSPKTIWLATGPGERVQVFKPYTNEMELADPDFVPIRDQGGDMVAYCWYAAKGRPILGKMRPTGKIFTVSSGESKEERRRFAGLVYKLFGFSIGDRTLPLKTLWPKEYTRPLWFTGEIHVINKDVTPTTDRSNFVENSASKDLYAAGQRVLAKDLNRRAEQISDTRGTYDLTERARKSIADVTKRVDEGKLDRAQVKGTKAEIDRLLNANLKVKPKCVDDDVSNFTRDIANLARELKTKLDNVRGGSDTTRINNLVEELKLTTQPRKLYTIVMEVLRSYYADQGDLDTFYEVSDRINDALRKKL